MDNVITIDKYTRKVEITDTMEELIDYKVDEILRHGNSHGRSRETLEKHVERGLVTEIAVADIFNCDFNSIQRYDSSNPHSFAYDLISRKNGSKLEVKTLGKDNSHNGWLNVNMNKDKSENLKYGIYPDVQTAVEFQEFIDYIIFCTNVNNVVRVKYVFKMRDFCNNLQYSKHTREINSTHYLNPSNINLIK